MTTFVKKLSVEFPIWISQNAIGWAFAFGWMLVLVAICKLASVLDKAFPFAGVVVWLVFAVIGGFILGILFTYFVKNDLAPVVRIS